MRIAVASVMLSSAMMLGIVSTADTAYADEANESNPKVVSISSALESQSRDDDTAKNPSNAQKSSKLGEGLAAQVAKMHSDAISAMPTREDALLEIAKQQLGVPYVYGGTTPSGFDCSGFTQYCFKQALGIELPRTADAQYGLGESVALNDLQPGDLVFWGSRRGIYHVGIYVGDGNYIHAGASAHSICIQSMSAYSPTSAKRIL